MPITFRNDLFIAETHYNRSYQICIHFTVNNVLQFRLSFPRSLLFYFLASLVVFSVL